MTPKERVAKAMSGQKPDKLPMLTSASNSFICHRYGLSIEDYLTKPADCAAAHINFAKDFKLDYMVVGTGYIWYGCGPELGIEWRFAGDQFPGFVKGPVQRPADLDKIKVPEKPSGYFANFLEVNRLVNQAVGREIHLTTSSLGPFSMACFLRGIEEMMLDLIRDPGFFRATLAKAVDLSEYIARQVLATGLERPILNEIFVTPEMIRPDDYHRLIAPAIEEVQRRVGAENVPNGMGAFMGKASDPESQVAGRALFNAFFGAKESVDAIRDAARYTMPGWPFPASISGRALSAWNIDAIIEFLNQALDFLVKEEGLFPSISLVAVLANSPEEAEDLAAKIKVIDQFRNEYQL